MIRRRRRSLSPRMRALTREYGMGQDWRRAVFMAGLALPDDWYCKVLRYSLTRCAVCGAGLSPPPA